MRATACSHLLVLSRSDPVETGRALTLFGGRDGYVRPGRAGTSRDEGRTALHRPVVPGAYGGGMDDDDLEDEHWELVMPFVVAVSEGGPYDDESFVAGWVCGQLSIELRNELHVRTWIPRGALPQADLLAMSFARVCSVEQESDDGEFVLVHICTGRLAARLP